MMKHQVFVFDGDGVGLGDAVVGEVLGLAEVEPEAGAVAVARGVVFAAVGVADFDGEAEAVADWVGLAEATGT